MLCRISLSPVAALCPHLIVCEECGHRDGRSSSTTTLGVQNDRCRLDTTSISAVVCGTTKDSPPASGFKPSLQACRGWGASAQEGKSGRIPATRASMLSFGQPRLLPIIFSCTIGQTGAAQPCQFLPRGPGPGLQVKSHCSWVAALHSQHSGWACGVDGLTLTCAESH